MVASMDLAWDASLAIHWHESTCKNAPSREILIHHPACPIFLPIVLLWCFDTPAKPLPYSPPL